MAEADRIAALGPDDPLWDPNFDHAAAMAHIAKTGYAFPCAEVRVAMRVAGVVYRVGWEGARDLLDYRWTRAEADLMAELVTTILDHEDALRERGRRDALLRAMGGA